MAQTVEDLLANAGDPALIPESGRFPGEGSGNPLWYSCLENPMDRGAWRGYSPRVAKRRTGLSAFQFLEAQHIRGLPQ